MTGEIGRREVLRLAGVAALLASVSACTRSVGGSGATTSASGGPSPSRTSTPTYAQLAAMLSGPLLLAGQAGYNPSALLYNPRFARQPAPHAVAQCRSPADVAACVRFAADGGAPLRLRNGGHSYGGWSSGPGLVADLAALNSVAVDTGSMTATVGAGALLADVYTALAAKGVSIGAGSCATVGVTGLTLGGGVGVLTRAYGLTCDQVKSMSVVTADGQARTVDSAHDADLFWALRGGGPSFAAVTSLTFAVRPAPTVTTFFLQWPWTAAPAVLAAWQHWVGSAPRELWSTCKLLGDPGRGLKVTVSGTWIGSGSAAPQLQSLLAATPKPTSNSSSSGSYGSAMLGEAGCSGETAAACISDALTPAKRQPFAATSSILQQPLPDAGISAIVAAVAAGLGVPKLIEGGVSFDSVGGAVADVAADATAVPWRQAMATVQYTATWAYADAALDPAPFDTFVRGERQALSPWLGSAAYFNYADPSITDFGTAYWGANLARLQQVKRTYDGQDVFSFPQAVPV